MASIDTRFSESRSTPIGGLDLLATGAALTSALVGLFILCVIAAQVWPTAGLAHGWIRLFATNPDNVARMFIEGVLGSIAGAWIATLLFVPVYNWFVRR